MNDLIVRLGIIIFSMVIGPSPLLADSVNLTQEAVLSGLGSDAAKVAIQFQNALRSCDTETVRQLLAEDVGSTKVKVLSDRPKNKHVIPC